MNTIGGVGQRLSVFVVFAALAAAAAASTFVAGAPAAAPTGADLAAREAKMSAAARLHTAAAIAEPAGPAGWCAACHPGLPHPGAGIERAMLNEHAARMDCLLCHWPAVGDARPVPVWLVQAGATSFLTVLPRERSSQGQLAALRATVLARRRCFDRGPGCAGCHRSGVIDALVRPGATPGRKATLGRLQNHFALAPGEKWYFPRVP